MPESTTVTPTIKPRNWTYNIREAKSLIRSPVKDEYGRPVYKNGEPEIKAFMMFRYYLVLHSEKYATVVEYNINRPNRAKTIPFFTHRETKKQYLPKAMQSHLAGRFNPAEAQQIVSECVSAVQGGRSVK